MAWNDGIEGIALEIARTNVSPLRVMAGPGTGKSFAMRRRVARIIEEEGANPERILAVTFTRTAAKDLKDELQQMDIEGCENIRAGTLHSFCFSLLSKNRVLEYLNRHPNPLITFKSSGVLRFQAAPMISDIEVVGDFGAHRDITKRIRAYEAAWARLQRDQPGWVQDPIDAQFDRALINWLEFHQGMLIGELVPYALRYLKDNPQAEERGFYEYVIVDEYQDLNKAEQELIDLISEDSSKSIVGDVDQSIYSFKHAHPEGILEYSDTHAGTHDENLNECRRCPVSVVDIADSLIRNNHPNGDKRRLTPHVDNPEGEVHLIQSNSYEQEAELLSVYVNKLINEDKYGPGDILILTPRKLIGYSIRDNLRNLGISVHSYYHEETFEASEAQEAFSKLSLLVNKEDRLALRYLVGFGSGTWLRRGYSEIRNHCNHNNLTPFECLKELETGDFELPWTKELVNRFVDIKVEIATLEKLSVTELIDELFPEGNEWAGQLRELSYNIYSEDLDLESFLNELTTRITQPVMPEEGDYVRIMSLHKSKGLSSPVVIIAGCVEGIIPFIDEDLEGDERRRSMEEQRRLFYVGITRTREVLVLSSFSKIDAAIAHQNGILIRGYGNTITSRFIGELGPTAPRSIRANRWLKED